jgi:osmotically-inducible protein OsmY
VVRALARNPGAGAVTVEVTDEVVRLRGQVPDAATLRALEDAVAVVEGVETVHNLVVVGPSR